MQGVKNYVQKYNETHYRQINMRVSEDIAVKFDELKPKFGSAPKLLLAGLNAIIDLDRAKNALKNLSDSGFSVIKEKDEEIADLNKKLIDLTEENNNLKKQIGELKSRSFFDYLFNGLKSEGSEK